MLRLYTVQQLQALDYLLKRITNVSSYYFFKKNLKFVVEINNSYWYGDFIQLDGTSATQLFIDNSGDIERDSYYPTGNNAIIMLKEIWDAYVDECSNKSWSNPFKRMDNLALLFESLLKLLNSTKINEDSSPFHPYLLNASSLDGSLQLPFINLNGEKIQLVSIIEVKD